MTEAGFALDPRLDAAGWVLGDWPICRLLLHRDSRFPWLVLVPRRAGLVEWFDLPAGEREASFAEACRAAEALRRATLCDKINIGALGNVVPQLHIHVVARRAGDAAWPGPVWGAGSATPYADGGVAMIDRLRAELAI